MTQGGAARRGRIRGTWRTAIAAACLLAFAAAGNLPAALTALPGAPVTLLAASQPPAPEQQDEFVPISELPPQERLPAAPLLIAAYVFVLAVLFVYVTMVARRLTALQRDVARLEGDLARRGRG